MDRRKVQFDEKRNFTRNKYLSIFWTPNRRARLSCHRSPSVQLSGELAHLFFSMSWTLRRSNPGLDSASSLTFRIGLCIVPRDWTLRRPCSGSDFALSQGIGLCVVPHVQDWTLRRPKGFRLCVIPRRTGSHLPSRRSWCFFLSDFLLTHAPSDVQFCFLVYVVFFN